MILAGLGLWLLAFILGIIGLIMRAEEVKKNESFSSSAVVLYIAAGAFGIGLIMMGASFGLLPGSSSGMGFSGGRRRR
jgi:hypothetical protein